MRCKKVWNQLEKGHGKSTSMVCFRRSGKKRFCLVLGARRGGEKDSNRCVGKKGQASGKKCSGWSGKGFNATWGTKKTRFASWNFTREEVGSRNQGEMVHLRTGAGSEPQQKKKKGKRER